MEKMEIIEMVENFGKSDADDLKLIKELRERLEREENLIARKLSGYYVAIVEWGPDDDFVRAYTPIGHMTESEARAFIEEHYEDSNYTECIMVSKNDYHKFICLGNLSSMLASLSSVENSIDTHDVEVDLPGSLRDKIEASIATLREELGLEYRWQYVELRY